MTLLLLLKQASAGSATGTAFRSFVEAGMVLPDWQIDDYLVATVQTHDSTGAAAAADAVPSYVIRNAATGATVDSGDFAAVVGVDGFYVLRRQLTEAAGFAAMATYTLRVEATVGGVVAADTVVFRVGAWTEIRSTTGKNTLDALQDLSQPNVRAAVGLASANLDAQLAVLPTAGAIADAVHDEQLSGHTTPGSAGAVLSAAGAAADPLLNPVPGSYPSGTAGAALGRIGAGTITTVAPVTPSGAVALDRGYDYYAADGRALAWTNQEASWPDLTGATATLYVGALVVAGVITQPTGPATITVELSRTQTAALAAGVHAFRIDVTLANTHLILQVRGSMTVS